MILTEHGLSQEDLENTRLEGYFLVGAYTRKAHIKGGVAGYAKIGLEKDIKLLKTSNADSELVCETALFEIKFKKNTLNVLGVYRPPRSNLDQSINILTDQLEDILSTKAPTIILGDVNVDNLKEQASNTDNTKLEEFLTSFDLKRLNLPPTRITPDTRTSIDWICTNIDLLSLQTLVIQSGLSDHTAQLVTLQLKSKREICMLTEKKRIFNHKTMRLFKTRLQTQNWESVCHTDNANQAYNNFHHIIQRALDDTCPITKIRNKKNKKRVYWDDECATLKSLYIKALDKELCSGRPEDKVETASRKKAYDQKLKLLRRKQTTNFIHEADNKSKALWQIINSERKGKPDTDSQWQLQNAEEKMEDPSKIASAFNIFFATVAERTLETNSLNTDIRDQDTLPNTDSRLNFQPATELDIQHAIDSLKPKTSSGMDQISAKLIKTCKDELIKPLTTIINKSLQQGEFPTLLKIAKVYPKLKNGARSDLKNYRPISLISTFSKIYEKIVLNRLLPYLTEHKLLTPQQHGFLKGKSTTTALTQVTEHIIDQLDKGHIATSLFLDFSKAFDCLNHNQLLKKMESLGIKGKTWQWFSSYLSGRQQFVEIQQKMGNNLQKFSSNLVSIQRGVPQGSVLGPVLFLLLTNDLPDHLGKCCQTTMYADDTVLTLTDKSADTLNRTTNTTFKKTKSYCINNELALNENKTVQLIFTTKNKDTAKSIDGVDAKNMTKYLGVIIDSKLTWKDHINQLCKKLCSSIYVIRRTMQRGGVELAKTAYHALFESHLTYGLIVWGGATAVNLERILLLQKRAIRCLAGLKYQESCREAFKQLKILTVPALYIREVIMHTVRTNQTRHKDIHDHNTRHAASFALPPHKLSLYKMKPSYKGAVFYNNLPEKFRKNPEQHLKTKLTTWLQDQPFYSEQEFLNTCTLHNHTL